MVVEQYFGASGRPASARGQKFFWDLRARMAVFNDFAPPCMYSMCDRLGWISLGRILIHIIFLFPMDGTGDGFGRLVLRSAYGTAPHPFGGLNFTRAQRRVVKRGEARQGAQSQRESIFRAAFRRGQCLSADQASHQFVRARRQRRSRRAFCVRTSLQQSSAPVPDIL